MYIYIYVYTHTHTYMYIYAHTHTQTYMVSWNLEWLCIRLDSSDARVVLI